MHKPSEKFPRQRELMFPLLTLIADNGGTIDTKTAYHELAQRHRIPTHHRDETVVIDHHKVKVWERYVRFVKLRCQESKFLTASDRGVWALTDEGKEALRHASAAVHVRVFVSPDETPVAAQVELNVGLPTVHTLHRGDARDLQWISDDSIPLLLTSIPYFNAKEYEHVSGQLADLNTYEDFLAAMQTFVAEAFRVAMPGARMAINSADVLLSRAKYGTHHVLPLSANMITCCRKVGFQCLTGVLWRKIQNCRSSILGTPGMPRGVIPAEIESILLFRKPGEFPPVTREQREASRLSMDEYKRYFRPIWDDIPGVSHHPGHPAPWPVEIPRRLIRMFSFAGQVCFDAFGGEGNTALAAIDTGRSSLTNEIAPGYFLQGFDRVRNAAHEAAASRRQSQAAFAF